MQTALVIMAAGIGSRFRGGIKQLTPVGPNGELIIDYSIHDALAAGFNEIVFIIRREIEAQVRAQIGDRLAARIGREPNLTRVSYVFQELDDLPPGCAHCAAGRAKPWGTGHALRACRTAVNVPFAVINADDYYGRQAFFDVHDFLCAHGGTQREYCMGGFVLKNTLSPHGSVTRGLCSVDGEGFVRTVTETPRIAPTARGAAADGREIDPDTPVAMNLWGFTPDFLDRLETGFVQFLHTADLAHDEYLLPTVVGGQIVRGEIRVKCLRSPDVWFGVTYREDRAEAERRIAALIRDGVYPAQLWQESK